MAYELKYPQNIPLIRCMYSDGNSIKNIAEKMNMPYNTVVKYIHRLLASGSVDMRPKTDIGGLKKHMAEWDRVISCPEIWWTIDPAVTGKEKEFADIENVSQWWKENETEWMAACAAAHKVLVQMAREGRKQKC